jgi:hypothetical protein
MAVDMGKYWAASDLVGPAVNNGRRQPLQGMDVVVYIQDQATGSLIPMGEFTGFQHVIRNATEPYLPLGHRSLQYLDGEFQIGWTAEQGKVNLDAIKHVMGFSYLGPALRIGRSPRFQIVVEYNAEELQESDNTIEDDADGGNNRYSNTNDLLTADLYGPATTVGAEGTKKLQFARLARCRYVFGFCKVDAYTTGIMAGRSVIADRIEGLAETWYMEKLEKPIVDKAVLPRNVNANIDNGFEGIYQDVKLKLPLPNRPTWAVDPGASFIVQENGNGTSFEDAWTSTPVEGYTGYGLGIEESRIGDANRPGVGGITFVSLQDAVPDVQGPVVGPQP